MDHRFLHNSAPPTPAMTEGPTHSDISTAKSSSTMSATLHQRLRDRKLELQREGKLVDDGEDVEGSGAEENAGTISVKKSRHMTNERRVVSTTTSRKPSAQMSFREQDQHIAKLDKQNFDLKLRVYHQEVNIREMRTEIEQKNGESDELMKLIDDQQKELDKREASLKEAVDSILLLQDKVRHLEKLAKTSRPSSNRLQYKSEAHASGEAPERTMHRSAVHSNPQQGPKLTVRRASHSDVLDDSNEGSDAEDGLDVPFKEELDAIDRDHRGLRARTVSALSRNTEDSRYHGDYMPPRSPAMSVLSEGDFESVYNWKEQSTMEMHPPRPHSADLSELWTESKHQRGHSRELSDHLEQDVDHETEEEEPSQEVATDASRTSMVSPRALSKTEGLIPGLEVSNTFNRTTPTKMRQTPSRSIRQRNSDPSLPNLSLATPPTTVQGSPFNQVPARMASLRKGAVQSEDSPRNQTGNTVPATPLRRIRPAMGSSREMSGSRSPGKGAASGRSPKVPSTAPFSARVGRFENYGFLDSQPSTPVLLGKKKQISQRSKAHPFPRAQPDSVNAEYGSPTPPQPPVASRKDQQILEYIAQQRVSDWIDKAPRRTPAMAAPMFADRRGSVGNGQGHSEYHPLPPTPPDTASAANSASRKTSGILDAGQAQDEQETASARPNYKRAVESYPTHSQNRRSGTMQNCICPDVNDTRSQHAQVDRSSVSASDRARALGLAAGAGHTRDVVFNSYDNASIDPTPSSRNVVSFAPVLETHFHHRAEDADAAADDADDAEFVPTEETLPANSKSHPPVSLATSRLGFAGRFRRRRGSSSANSGSGGGSTGAGSGGRVGSALQGSIGANTAAAASSPPLDGDEEAIEEGSSEGAAADTKARRRASFGALKFSTLGRKIF